MKVYKFSYGQRTHWTVRANDIKSAKEKLYKKMGGRKWFIKRGFAAVLINFDNKSFWLWLDNK